MQYVRRTIMLLSLCFPLDSAHAEANFDKALATAGPGTVILLSGGNYGKLTLEGGGGAPGNPLVIQAADLADPPRFSELTVNEVSYVVLDGLTFDYTFKLGDLVWEHRFNVNNSHDVTIRNALFDGDVARGLSAADDGFGFSIGLAVRWTDGFVLENSEVRGFHRGMGIAESANITIRANDIHDLRSDGMNFAQVTDVLIADNNIHDFDRSLTSDDHADMIQFWTTGTKTASQRITIRDNVLNSGKGAYTQSIFIRNERVDQKEAGDEMFYRDISITGNVIINAHLHGITVGETDGLMIANNTLVQNPASKVPSDDVVVFIPQIRVAGAARNVQILRNVVTMLDPTPPGADWIVDKNYAVQNLTRSKGGFYDLVFADPARGDPRDLASFAYRADGVLAGAGIGAPRLDTVKPTISAGRPSAH